MGMLCALDWRHSVVTTTLTPEADGSIRVALGHGPDEVVLHLSRDSLDALTLAGLTCPRPSGAPPWPWVDLSCF